MEKKQKAIIAAVAVPTALILPGLYSALKIQHYSVKTDKLKRNVRIALVTDLHSCKYGEKQSRLIDLLDSQSPDLILLGGDFFDDSLPNDNSEAFLAGTAGRYPIFYVTGNHEFKRDEEAYNREMAIIQKYGVTRLNGKSAGITVNGESLNICGIDDPFSIEVLFGNETITEEQLDNIRKEIKSEQFSILLSHRPELIELFAKYGFDLVLSGHAHGGQWRIPFVLNGLLAPNQGLFPKYAGGMYEVDKTKLIVSRGLAKETTPVPRIYNRRELVIIDIN